MKIYPRQTGRGCGLNLRFIEKFLISKSTMFRLFNIIVKFVRIWLYDWEKVER